MVNYKGANNGGKAIDTDHFTQYMDMDLEFSREKPERREILNFKNSKAQDTFKMLTSETDAFTDCFSGDLPLFQKVENWRIVLNSNCQKAQNNL